MERWLPVVGYEGKYEISDHGRVRSAKRRGTSGVIVSPMIHHGYCYARLWSNNRESRQLVHRLVLLTFVGPPPEGKPFGLHADDDPSNNALSNLYWGNDHDNTMDRVKNGRHNRARMTSCVHGHDFTPENTYIRPDGQGRQCKQCIRDRAKGA